jgi:hypothetical protein
MACQGPASPKGYAVTNNDLSRSLRSLFGGSPRGSTSPTAAIVVQGSSEGGAHELLADGGETPRPQGASNLNLALARS